MRVEKEERERVRVSEDEEEGREEKGRIKDIE